MKVIGVLCSARPGSGSGAVVREFLRGAEEAGHQVQTVVLSSGNFGGCTGCHGCKKSETGACVRRDAMTPYLEALPQADVVVFGAGNYMGWPQGQAWDFLHRHFCLSLGIGAASGCRIPAGKKLFPVFSQGVPVPDMYRARYEQYLAPFQDWGFDIQEMLIASGPTAEAVKLQAYELGKNL